MQPQQRLQNVSESPASNSRTGWRLWSGRVTLPDTMMRIPVLIPNTVAGTVAHRAANGMLHQPRSCISLHRKGNGLHRNVEVPERNNRIACYYRNNYTGDGKISYSGYWRRGVLKKGMAQTVYPSEKVPYFPPPPGCRVTVPLRRAAMASATFG